MTNFDRATGYVAKMPPAIEGEDGSGATFAVAKVLIHDFALPEPEAWQLLCEYNERCSPPWSEGELRHKMESAKRLTRAKRERGALANNRFRFSVYCSILGRGPIHATEPEPRILGQVSIEMFEQPKPPVMTSTEKAVIEELTGHDPVKALENPPLAEPEDIEARRIAGELRKLYNVGAIAGSDDPEVAFYASLIRGFGATFLPKGIEEATVAVLPEGRRGAMALEPGDTFDFSNPSDVAEFEKLYRRPCRKGPQACK